MILVSYGFYISLDKAEKGSCEQIWVKCVGTGGQRSIQFNRIGPA